MKPTRHPLTSLKGGKAAFVVMAILAIVLQMGMMNHLLDIMQTPVWRSGQVAAACLHGLCVWLGDALLLVLPALVMGRHWRWVQWPVLVLFTLWGVAQLMYYPTYSDLMPPSSFLLWQNLDGMVIDSAVGNWAKRDWLFVLPMLCLLAIDLLWLRRLKQSDFGASRWKRVVVALAAFVVLRLVGDTAAYAAYWHRSLSVPEYLNDNYTHVRVTHASYFASNGLAGYLGYTLAVELAQHHQLNTEERQRVEHYLATQPQYTDNTYASGRQNLILIVVESLNSWVIDLKVDGQEVTPVLNALCRDTTALVGRHMRRQVQNGGSSDGHFMYNTGLLPLVDRAVSMVYGEAPYPTLVKALDNPHALHICGDPPTLWNTEATARNYGYEFHGSNETKPMLKDNDWQWDKVIFEHASRLLSQQAQPFVAEIVTLGMHEPYTRCIVPESWVSRSGQFTPKVRNYLERTAVFDRELGKFIERLKQDSLYQHSLIAIVSDHNDLVDDQDNGRKSIDPDGRDCVMIVLNSGQGRHIDENFGQIDVYPTLLDLMGCNQSSWKGVGNSLMRATSHGAASSPVDNGGTARQREAWEVSRLMITSRWFDRTRQ